MAFYLVLSFIKLSTTLWQSSKRLWTDLEKSKQKALIWRRKLQDIQKWYHIGLPKQRELSAYFGLQGVMHLELFKINLEKNIGSQWEGVPAFDDGRRLPVQGWPFAHGWKCTSTDP